MYDETRSNRSGFLRSSSSCVLWILTTATLGSSAAVDARAQTSAFSPHSISLSAPGGDDGIVEREDTLDVESGSSACWLPNVLLLHADWDDCTVMIEADLTATGLFGTVDVFDAKFATPAQAMIDQYDVVMTWANFFYFQRHRVGSRLANYVDGGGAVVVAMFGHSALNSTLGGRWFSEGYAIIPANGWTSGGPRFLGNVLDPTHPIMNGVTSFDGGSCSCRPTDTSVAPGATRIAEWDDGATLVAVGAPGRVDLGMWPGGFNGCGHDDGWNYSTDGMVLIANALLFAASGVTVPSAVSRNAGPNPASYTASAPTLGGTWTASVDLSLTGHSQALVLGCTDPAQLILGGGQVVLIGGPAVFSLPLTPGPVASWSVPIPNEYALSGCQVFTQAAHVLGVKPFALSNAQDLRVGY